MQYQASRIYLTHMLLLPTKCEKKLDLTQIPNVLTIETKRSQSRGETWFYSPYKLGFLFSILYLSHHNQGVKTLKPKLNALATLLSYLLSRPVLAAHASWIA